MRPHIFALVFPLLVLLGCQPSPEKAAVARQMEDYPESRVQDIYKSFCQDNLGPGHLIPDPQSARNYLESELRTFRGDLDSARYDAPAIMYYPVGDQGNYVRVDLSVVLDGLIGEETYLDAIVRSANKGKRLTEEQWVAKWREVEKVIRKDFPDIPDAEKDLEMIDSYVEKGDLIMHHSEAFSNAYKPHYRIIARDIFEKEIKPLIDRRPFMYIDRIRINWDKVSLDSYLTRIPAIGLLQELAFRKPVTFFVGENGSGKSTLLEAIAIAYGFNPEGGTLNYNFSTHDDYSELCDALTIAQGAAKGRRGGFFLRAESFYNVSTKAIEYERELGRPMYGDRTLHEQSHGESFLSFIRTFTRTGLFIMDEPEAALSPQRQLSLFSRIAEMAKEGSQYIIVTHSPILLAMPGADIIGFDEKGIRYLEYEETESYRITEMMINHRDLMVSQLLQEED